MYLYFDKKGILKEIINDKALRQGDYGINKMYIYVDEQTFDSIDVSYLLPDNLIVGPENYDTFTNPESTDPDVKKLCYIPYDRKRDLEYFSYEKAYKFIVVDLENDINGNSPLDQAGTVHCSLIINLTDGNQMKLGEVNFDVEVSGVLNQKVVASQEYLSLSDYQFLRKLISNFEYDDVSKSRVTVVQSMSQVEDIEQYLDGTIFLERSTGLFFKKIATSPYYEQYFLKGPLPNYDLTGNENALDFINNNGLNNKFFTFNMYGSDYIGLFHSLYGTTYYYYFFNYGGYRNGSGDLTDKTFTNIYASSPSVAYETTNNKVALDSSNTTAQYPNAKSVYDECQNIREIAEGKCKTLVLTYSDTVNTAKYFHFKYVDAQGELHDFSSQSDMETYLSGKTCKNSVFNSTDISIIIDNHQDDCYLLLSGYEFGVPFYTVVIKMSYLVNFDYKKGDIILITETSVPDRWISGISAVTLAVHQLETTGLNLNNYYTKPETNTLLGYPLYSDQATYSVGDLVVYNDTLYRCTTAVNPAESFNNSKWVATDVDSEVVHKTGDETISGEKTFSNGIIVGKSNTEQKVAIVGRYGTNYIYTGTSNQLCFDNLNQPTNAAYIDTAEFYIGNNRNLKIKANKAITDGTNSVTIADIVGGSWKTISYTDYQALSSTDRLALLDTGCRIIGTISTNVPAGRDVINPILFPRREYVSYSQGILIAGSSNNSPTVATYEQLHSGTTLTIKTLFAGNDQHTTFHGNVKPNTNNSLDLGSSSQKWKNIYSDSNTYTRNLFLSNALFNDDSSTGNQNYGLTLPNTTSWTANKTIATLDDIGLPAKNLYEHKIEITNVTLSNTGTGGQDTYNSSLVRLFITTTSNTSLDGSGSTALTNLLSVLDSASVRGEFYISQNSTWARIDGWDNNVSAFSVAEEQFELFDMAQTSGQTSVITSRYIKQIA